MNHKLSYFFVILLRCPYCLFYIFKKNIRKKVPKLPEAKDLGLFVKANLKEQPLPLLK